MAKRSETEPPNSKDEIEARPHGPPPRRTTTTPVPDGTSQGGDPAAESFFGAALVTSDRQISNSQRLDGVAVSPGIAIARAHCLHDIPVGSAIDPDRETVVLDELASFERALQLTATELQVLYDKVAAQVGDSPAAIFAAHLAILRDPVDG